MMNTQVKEPGLIGDINDRELAGLRVYEMFGL